MPHLQISWRHERFFYPLAMVISALVLFFTQTSTTPFLPIYRNDSSIFFTIGKGWLEGYIPYRDLYDHKGPAIFLINALGAWLAPGTLGIFLLEVFAFGSSLILVHKISRLFLGIGQSLWVNLHVILFVVATSQNGNLTEEWSLPLNLLCSYLALKFLKSGASLASHPQSYSLIYGLCLGIQIALRLTNAAPLCGLILAFTILLCTRRSWFALGRNAGCVLVGTWAVLLPFCLYFAHHQCLGELLNASFLVNLHYATDGTQAHGLRTLLVFLLTSSSVPVLLVLAFRLWKRGALSTELLTVVTCLTLPTVCVTILGEGYLHYWLLLGVSYTLTLVFLFQSLNGMPWRLSVRRLILFMLLLLLSLPFIPENIFRLRQCMSRTLIWAGSAFPQHTAGLMDSTPLTRRLKPFVQRRIKNAPTPYQMLAAQIPEADRNSVLTYECHPEFNLRTGIMPYRGTKYFTSQDKHAKANPNIRPQLQDMMRINPPKYILCPNLETAANSPLQPQLTTDYRIKYRQELPQGQTIILFQRNSTPPKNHDEPLAS